MPRQTRVPVNIEVKYRCYAKTPSWREQLNGSEPRLTWGYRPLGEWKEITVRPADLYTGLMELDITDPTAVLEFARGFGPYFGLDNVLGDYDDIVEGWQTHIEQEKFAADLPALRTATGAVVDLLVRDDDNVGLVAIAGMHERLRLLGHHFGVLHDDEEPPPREDSTERQRWAREARVQPIGAEFVVGLERGTDGVEELRAPVFILRPNNGYGIFNVAELGLLELIVSKSSVRQCLRPSCGRLFLQSDRRHRKYCPEGYRDESDPGCYNLWHAERKQQVRAQGERPNS